MHKKICHAFSRCRVAQPLRSKFMSVVIIIFSLIKVSKEQGVKSQVLYTVWYFYGEKLEVSLGSFRSCPLLSILYSGLDPTDESVPPVAQPHRRIPFHVRQQLEEQLRKDEELGVIERIEGPTPWVSPIVVAPKPKQPGKIRVCLDMRQANQAVKRERHPHAHYQRNDRRSKRCQDLQQARP